MLMIIRLRVVSILLMTLFFSCKIEFRNNDIINQNQELYKLCKIWGFLKYYHPHISNYNVNWDSVLISNIDYILQAKDNKSIDKIFDSLVHEYCVIKDTNQVCNGDSILSKNIEFSWIKDTNEWLETTINEMNNIQSNCILFNNNYVSPYPYVNNPNFEKDTLYNSSIFPDKNIRLLSLFRYWNMINYYYPYKYLMDNNWDSVLLKQIPVFMNCYDTISYHLAVCKLTSFLNDNHAYITSKALENYWGNRFLPVKMGFVEGETVIIEIYSDSLAKRNNLKIGDIIHEINGVKIETIRDSLSNYFSGSNKSQVQHMISYYLSRSPSDKISLRVFRNKNFIDIVSNTYPRKHLAKIRLKEKSNSTLKYFDNNIAYVDLSMINYENVDSLFTELLNKNSLILDLRKNCNFIVHNLCELLFENNFRFYSYTTPSYKTPGFFCFSRGEETGPLDYNVNYYKGNIVLLVNHQTQSIGEFTTMALSQHPNSIILGSTTAGADGNVSKISLPGGIETYISGIGIYWIDGTETQRKGINPDIIVTNKIKYIVNNEDILLNTALKYLNSNN